MLQNNGTKVFHIVTRRNTFSVSSDVLRSIPLPAFLLRNAKPEQAKKDENPQDLEGYPSRQDRRSGRTFLLRILVLLWQLTQPSITKKHWVRPGKLDGPVRAR